MSRLTGFDPTTSGSAGSGAAAKPAEEVPLHLRSTTELLVSARDGDPSAAELLFRRTMPGLQRWARGRLPTYARELCDTEDLVQDTVINALRRWDGFEVRHPGSWIAYLRQAILNRIRDEVRRARRRPIPVEFVDDRPDDTASPLEKVINRVDLDRYEAALERLRPDDRLAILGRIEHNYSYEELAVALGKPTSNAARVAVRRALMRLAEEMSDEA
jgi:RNA polymerase sigma-70 factor (ECF subfamily)